MFSKKNIIFLIVIILGLSLLIGGVSSTKYIDYCNGGNVTHKTTWTKTLTKQKQFEGIVKKKRKFYRKYYRVAKFEIQKCKNTSHDSKYGKYYSYSYKKTDKTRPIFIKAKKDDVYKKTALQYIKREKLKGKIYKVYTYKKLVVVNYKKLKRIKVTKKYFDSYYMRELKMNFLRQPDGVTCGPTSLKISFSYYKLDYSIKTLRKLCKTNRDGTTPGNLTAAANKANKKFVLIEEDYENFNQIIKHIDNKHPLIIQLQTTKKLGYSGSYGHYIVVAGYNKLTKQLKIADPLGSVRWVKLSIVTEAIKKRLMRDKKEEDKIKPIKVLEKK
ncbi:cysteine peptidase family C39 domain-containing protein [Methanobrevibacter filiformis]|uniref:Peptidase C39 family protein n=1 Tax=Methanobrevibacter filiformis TaxID=55758 RepID=A0A166F973_9EURY|nr:cysteine peptidase family C39 domain-containing protein [Methanobrevibacter filiformis]KZX17429.1 peptidase C39 family protein [Methanobrevibacter filiformis]